MKLIKITTKNCKLFLSEIEKNFPINERRDNDIQQNLLNNEDFTPYYIEFMGELVGLFSLWQLKGFTFIEHFAVFDNFKNKGLGTKALELLKTTYNNLVLEAEPPKTEIAKRRIAFYERNGFTVCNNLYYQPPYRQGENQTRLNVLYFANSFDFETVKQELYSKVYNL